MWVREALEDLTAAEFASSLSLEAEDSTNGGKSSKKRAVDFDNVLAKLDARVEEMCIQMTEETSPQNSTCYVLDRRVMGEEGKTTIENACYVLAEDVGMGSVVYTTEQREALLTRLMATREKLVNFMAGSTTIGEDDMEDSIEDIRSQLQPTNYSSVDDTISELKSGFDPSLYVREDGTIDWDGALQDREALKKFGSAVWSRINGQEPESSGELNGAGGGDSFGDDFAHSKPVVAKIVETDAIREKKAYLDELTRLLNAMELEQTKLLNSGECNKVCCFANYIEMFSLMIESFCWYDIGIKQSVLAKPSPMSTSPP
jgi:hypothetical protein